MSKFIFYIIIILFSSNQTYGQNKLDVSSKKYSIKNYDFSIEVPLNWKTNLTNIFDSITVQNELHCEWTFPRHYSKIQKRKIPNCVTIAAFRKLKYETVDDFLNSPLPKSDTTDYYQTKYLSQKPDSISKNAIISYMSVSGHIHKLRVYYVINKNYCYFICLDAFEETYKYDIAAFEKLYSSLKFN